MYAQSTGSARQLRRALVAWAVAVAVLIVPTPTHAARDSASCSQFQAVGRQLTVAGYESRPSWVQVADDPSAPLLLMLHGLNGCVEHLQGLTAMDTADQRSVSLLWVSGVGQRTRVWDGWGTNGPATYSYLRAAIEAARVAGAVPRTVIVVGLSMGAVQAMMLGCAMPATFAGVVYVAGNDSYRCRVKVDVPLLAIGGAGDSSIGGTEGTHRVVGRWLDEAITCTIAPASYVVGSWTYCEWMVAEIVVEGYGHGWPLPPVYDTDSAITAFAWAIDRRTHPHGWATLGPS